MADKKEKCYEELDVLSGAVDPSPGAWKAEDLRKIIKHLFVQEKI
jgi:hypothetical protein